MTISKGWIRGLIVLGAALTLTACASYPSEPRYSTRAAPAANGYPTRSAQPYSGTEFPPPTDPADEAPPPLRAPTERIEGGALSAPVSSNRPATVEPAYPESAYPSADAPVVSAPRSISSAAGAAYEIQPGDTISGVGRRFQTPVQVLIDLNNLGPRGTITPGQRVLLPESAVDVGGDPYATGPSPIGVYVPEAGTPPPPPPPPPSGNAPLPTRPPAAAPRPAAPAPTASASGVALDWPVRGEVVRRFGPVGMGERNNGVNIAASAGAEVRAAAAGRVGYVGDDLAGQGLTVLVVHRDGWRTVYGHLGSTTVRDGDDVRAGQQVGTVGNTAGDGRPSIHFETWRMRGDEPTAVDPLTLLPR